MTTAATLGEPDQRWTDWPLWPSYLAVVHRLLGHLLNATAAASNGVVGRPLVYPVPPAASNRPWQVTRPDGSTLRLGFPEMIHGRPSLRLADTDRAGLYRVATADAGDIAAGILALAPDLRESESLDSLADEMIDSRLGFRPFHWTAGAEFTASISHARLRREWTVWLLAVALLWAVGESLLAWYCGKAR
ncbi:MAG: hypothetical protein NZ700_13555 [Gemmataceae bacterium]|nr:hypothetical protein [Gemmataceae bacterium]MDW8265940.1 hypothetical protein [Gemmataceae bacterium]